MKSKVILSSVFFCVAQMYSFGQTYYGTYAGNGGSGNYNAGFGVRALDIVTGSHNTAVGHESMRYNTSGHLNTAVGFYSLNANTTGRANSGFGVRAISANTTGYENSALGGYSLNSNTTGYRNTASGYSSLKSNTSGKENVAIGVHSMSLNTTGYYNTASGYKSLFSNSNGHRNTATGYQTLYSNTSGKYNSGLGTDALNKNTAGSKNTATGYRAMYYNTTGGNNTASGNQALYFNSTGSSNTGVGYFALLQNKTGNCNTALGTSAGPNTSNLTNTTSLGCTAQTTASNSVRVGNTAVTSIEGQVMFAATSDGRFKEQVKEDISGLDFITQLRPVSYTFNKAKLNDFLHVENTDEDLEGCIGCETSSGETSREVGFIAQEVEAIVKKSGYTFNGVDAPENENDLYSIRYAAFVIPLVKSVQELNEETKALRQLIELQQDQINSLLNVNQALTQPETVYSGNTLGQIYPNPFSETARIELEISESTSDAKVIIYNLEGKEINTIDIPSRGKTYVEISGSELNAGMYLYTLITDGKLIDTKRMVLTK